MKKWILILPAIVLYFGADIPYAQAMACNWMTTDADTQSVYFKGRASSPLGQVDCNLEYSFGGGMSDGAWKQVTCQNLYWNPPTGSHRADFWGGDQEASCQIGRNFNVSGPPPPPPPPPAPTCCGSLTVSTNNIAVGWSITKPNGYNCCGGSGTGGYYGGLEYNNWTISVTNPANYNCSADAGSRQLNAVNPDKSFSINCVSTLPPNPAATVDIRCNGLNACGIDSGGTANLTWTTANATTCTASNAWSGAKATAGSQSYPGLIANQTYTISCNGPGGSGSDSVVVTIVPNVAPTISNVSATEPNYCISVPGALIAWTYADSTAQTAYQVQIDNDPAFGSPNFDTGKMTGSVSSINATGTGAIGVGPAITWGTTYYSRVRVYDGFDLASVWTNQSLCTGPGCMGGTSWRTPNGPYPVVAFSSSPAKPVAGEPIQFTDTSVCTGGSGCAGWAWDFDDGTTAVIQNPSHTYSVNGTFSVKLNVTDAFAHTCGFSKVLSVKKALPFWREVLPF